MSYKTWYYMPMHEISNIIKSKKMTKKFRNIKLELEGGNDGVC